VATVTRSTASGELHQFQRCGDVITYSDDESGRRHSLIARYDNERGHLLEQLIQVGQSNSAMALAEKYRDFPTLLLMCERASAEQRSEMLHGYMVQFGSNVS